MVRNIVNITRIEGAKRTPYYVELNAIHAMSIPEDTDKDFEMLVGIEMWRVPSDEYNYILDRWAPVLKQDYGVL